MAFANGRIPAKNLAALPPAFSNKRERECLTSAAYASLVRMMLRAVADTGSYFSVWDAYRSMDEQVAMLKRNYTRVSRGRSKSSDRSYGGSTWAKKPGRPLTASPGYSNHGNGLAVDIHPGAIQAWLKSNAARFGWVNDVPSEPWHWSYLNPGRDQYRSEGTPDVAAMQKALGIEADGKPGPGTATAVRAYQKQHGLTADGIAGPSTMRSILGGGDAAPVPSVPAGGTSVPAPQPVPEYTLERHQTKNLRPGRIDEKRGLTGELNAITLHHWGSDGQDFDNVVSWLVADGNGNNSSSAHEVIEGGRVAVLASIEDGTWNSGSAQGNLDNYALECRPEADDATVRTVAARVAAVRAEAGWDVPLNLHRDYVATECPGRYVELRDTIDRLSRGEDIPAATTPTTGGELPTGKDLLVKLTDCPDYPLLRTPGHLCYYGGDAKQTSVSGKMPNSLVPGEIFGSGKTSGAHGLKKWQKKAGLKDDGRFGAKTKAKVKAVQKQAGLKVDGALGPVTWYALWLVS